MYRMKKILIPALALAFSTAAAFAEETPLWMRYCALSPDGQTIAFSYQGDLFTVPPTGMEPRSFSSMGICRSNTPSGTLSRKAPVFCIT